MRGIDPIDAAHLARSTWPSAAIRAVRCAFRVVGAARTGSSRLTAWCRTPASFRSSFTLDHVGPIARSAADAALLLEAIAGPDGLDPRQTGGLTPTPYAQTLTGDVGGLRIGIVVEGFGWGTLSEADVDEAVHDAGGGGARARSSHAGAAHEAGYASVPRTSARSCGYCGGSSAPAGCGPAVAQLLEHPGRAAFIVDEAVTVTEDELGARTVDHRLAIDVEPDSDSH